MAYRQACEAIQTAWDAVAAKWSADVKSRYFDRIYLPLMDEAEGMYQRNDSLESYAESCVNSLRV